MKPSAYLINTSRGGVVDQTALVESLKRGVIAGAGLDVFDPEPPQQNEPLLELDNVILAPHALCFTEQCVAGIGANDIRIILSIKQGEVPTGLVDPAVAESLIFRDKLEIYRELFS
jgi:D-3-phosphoglycerate dehydrogenase